MKTITTRTAVHWVCSILTGLALLAGPAPAPAQTLANLTVRVQAEALTNPARIRLRWLPDAAAGSYDIYRMNKGQSLFNAIRLRDPAGRPDTVSTFVDSTVVVGRGYEYRVRKVVGSGSGEGSVLAGIEVAATERRGAVVLLVDDTHAAYLTADLAVLTQDLVSDGWRVIRHDVAPTLLPPQVKALIQADYAADAGQVRAVFIVGHVAVPYSGAYAPDGHPDHQGAWPADVYYGSMAGAWTDNQLSITLASRPENRNVPGDGKFDQSTVPGAVQLEVGRVDMSRLPAFAASERDLLRRYLLKNHQYRHKLVTVAERGLVDDNFGVFGGEAFANNGWRNFTPFFGLGAAAVVARPYFSTLRTADYAWAFACGGGSYTSASGIGSTSDFANGPVRSVFNMNFGSYFGDWDNPNNYLRAALAAEGLTLTNCWAGRPNWYVQFMGLGETIGYCTRRSQAETRGGNVHVALLGDPTLRLHVLAPPTGLSIAASGGRAALAWAASPAAGAGYHVYRASTPAGPFVRLTAQPLTALAYADATSLPGTSSYLVRAVQLKNGFSGSYYNLSQGAAADFVAPAPVPSGGTWLGTASADWATPANWSTGAVPTRTGTARIGAGTPFAPVVGGGAFAVYGLALAPQARLTIAAGGRLAVATQPLVQPAPAGTAPTALVLAPATPTAAGGKLDVLDYLGGPQAGLALGAGTALTVGDRATLRLLGSLQAPAAALAFAPGSRLVFAPDTAVFTPTLRHYLNGPAGLTPGILEINKPSETLELSSAVALATQLENYGTLVTNNRLTLLSVLGRQAIVVPVVPGPGLPRTFGRFVGNFTMQVFVDGSRNAGLGYRHLTAPLGSTGITVRSLTTPAFTPVVNAIYNTTGNTVTPFPTVFSYNQDLLDAATNNGRTAVFDNGWQSPTRLNSLLSPSLGYTVNMPGNQTLSFTGQPNATRLYRDVWRHDTPDAGWALLGNPYPAPLDWDSLTKNDTNYFNVLPGLYTFKSDGQYTGSYASYLPGSNGTPGIGINGGGHLVPVGQGFFVRTVPPEPGNNLNNGFIIFTPDDLLTTPTAPAVQRTAPDPRPRLVLALRAAAGTTAHQTAVYFQAGATAGADARFDAPLLAAAGQALTLASEVAGQPVAINGLPPLAGAEVRVPLQLGAASAGRYELAVETLANLPAPYRAYLHDVAAGTYTDLALHPVNALTLPAAARVAGRYCLVFSPQARVLAPAPTALAALVALYPNPTHGRVALHLPPALRSRRGTPVRVVNTLGQVVLKASYPPESPELALPLPGLAAGIYTVQARTVAGTISRRLVVE